MYLKSKSPGILKSRGFCFNTELSIIFKQVSHFVKIGFTWFTLFMVYIKLNH